MNIQMLNPNYRPPYYVCDPKQMEGRPQFYNGTPPIHFGTFVWWSRELREIRDVHVTSTGTQLELL